MAKTIYMKSKKSKPSGDWSNSRDVIVLIFLLIILFLTDELEEQVHGI